MGDFGDAEEDEDITTSPAARLKGLLRVLEAVLFCCLSAVAILWVADRTRDLDFEPIPVTLCTAATCLPATQPDPWARYTALRDTPGLRTFAAQNVCGMAVDLLVEEATDPAALRVIADLEARGIIVVTLAGDGTGLVSAGRRNDGWGDVLRDATRLGATRSCHPSHYAPVIRPLILAWLLVLSLRLFRSRQAVWRTR